MFIKIKLQGILIVIWKISKKNISGIFIAVNVVDTVTNFGQVSLKVSYMYNVIIILILIS